MANSTTIRIEGVDALLRKVQGMPRAAQDAAQKVIARYALLIERDAKRLCPVDTGRLRSSIRTALEHLAASVFTDVSYAPHVHFGTVRTEARPFLFQAFEMHRNDFINAIKAAIRDAIK